MDEKDEFSELTQDRVFVSKLMTLLIDIILSDHFLDSNEVECLYNLLHQFNFSSDEDYISIYAQLKRGGKDRDYKQSLRDLLSIVKTREQVDIIKDAAMFVIMGDGDVGESESEIYNFLMFKLKQLNL